MELTAISHASRCQIWLEGHLVSAPLGSKADFGAEEDIRERSSGKSILRTGRNGNSRATVKESPQTHTAGGQKREGRATSAADKVSLPLKEVNVLISQQQPAFRPRVNLLRVTLESIFPL